jgi:hypothetical protein
VIRLLLVPLTVAAVTLPVVSGPLPGARVPLSAAAQKAGAVEMRQVAVVGSAGRRVALQVGRTRDGRLCVGSGAFFRCLGDVDAEPAYVIAGFGGIAAEPTWGALVGLAGPEVARVVVELQQGEQRTLRLQRLPGFAWRAFVFPPTGPNGRLPYTLHLAGKGPGRDVSVDMAYAASACVSDRNCFRPGRAWRTVGDSVEAPVGEARLHMEEAKRLALADPRVRKILGRATRLVQAPARWTSCGGKFLGAGIDIELFRAVGVDGAFPFVSFGKQKGGRAYAEGVLRLSADGVTHLLVSVDLNRRKVVSIDPSGDNVRLRSHPVVKQPTPAGVPDKAACQQGD